jgi:PAS domain S-box-containing protein
MKAPEGKEHPRPSKASPVHNYFVPIDEIADAVFVFSTDTTILGANPPACTLVGRSREDMLGRSVMEFFPPEDVPQAMQDRDRIVAGETIRRTQRVLHADGSFITVDVRLKLLSDGKALGIVRDVTEMLKMQEALRKSEESFHTLADNASEAIVIETHNGTVYANPYNRKLTGYTAEEMRYLSTAQIIAPEERERVAELTQRRLRGEPVDSTYESAIIAKDGRKIPVEVTAARTTWRGAQATIGMLRDITQRKQYEEQLLWSRDIMARAQRIANVGSWYRDYATQQVSLSEQLCRIYGLDADTYDGRLETIVDRVHPDDREKIAAASRALMSSGNMPPLEFRIVRPDGRLRSVRAYGQLLTDADGTATGSLGVVQDITEQRRLERDILEVSNLEKQGISQALHDSLGQQLTGIALLSKALEEELLSRKLECAEDAARLSALIRQALSQTRGMAYSLSPVDLEEVGLAAALERMGETTQNLFGISCRCLARQADQFEDAETAMNLYYIAQEAVTNACRHAEPTCVAIEFKVDKRAGCLVVKDNGKGLPQDVDRCGGMGLRIMRHRAAMIGGELSITTTEGQGTSVTCTFQPGAT